jgi:hypothetical protein
MRVARLCVALRSTIAAFLTVADAERVARTSATGAALDAGVRARATPGFEIASARWYAGGAPPPSRDAPPDETRAYRHRRLNGAAQCATAARIFAAAAGATRYSSFVLTCRLAATAA